MSELGSFLRLMGAAWALVRADALIPREAEPILPGQVRIAGKFLRLFAGPQARAGRPGERLALALERLGPVSIKLGQVLSTRSDIFGRAFAEDLSRLKDRLDPFPIEHARTEVARGLGSPVEELFSSFEAPVAAASLAQAHPATLMDGRKVAVKVLRPGIERRVNQDIAVMALAARIAENFGPDARRLEPRALAATVARSLQLELDLRFEAAGASELAEVMARDGYMQAPKVVWEGVSKRVLTLEWAPGLPLSDPGAIDQPGLDPRALADNLIRAFLAQALDHGVFHADLHEGNLFVAAPARLTAVDFGILGRLGATERRYLAEILYGFLERDYLKVARCHFDAGYVPHGHSVESFAQALRAVGEPIFGLTAENVSMGAVLTQLFEITALFDMRLRPELVLLQKTMMVAEGVARRLNPRHDIWAAADPVVRRYILRELAPQTRLKRVAELGLRAAEALAQRIESPPAAPVQTERDVPQGRLLWFALGTATAGLAFTVAALLMRH
jgi:ubiquinone biosynthesis protein